MHYYRRIKGGCITWVIFLLWMRFLCNTEQKGVIRRYGNYTALYIHVLCKFKLHTSNRRPSGIILAELLPNAVTFPSKNCTAFKYTCRANLTPYIFNMTLYRNISTYLLEFYGSNSSFIYLKSGLCVPDDMSRFKQGATFIPLTCRHPLNVQLCYVFLRRHAYIAGVNLISHQDGVSSKRQLLSFL